MRSEVKKWAKEHRDGNKWNVWQAFLVVGAITSAVTFCISFTFGSPSSENVNVLSSLMSTLADLALLPVTIGLICYLVNLIKGKKFELGQLFSKYSDFLRIFVTNLLSGIFIFLWSLLLIVPGIIKSISYFLVNYILADDDFKDLSAGEILDLSEKLMDGHKADYFMLNLYYFLLTLLGVFTFGILWIWTIPEMNLAQVKYATDLLEAYKKENKQEEVKQIKEVAEKKTTKKTKKTDK